MEDYSVKLVGGSFSILHRELGYHSHAYPTRDKARSVIERMAKGLVRFETKIHIATKNAPYTL